MPAASEKRKLEFNKIKTEIENKITGDIFSNEGILML